MSDHSVLQARARFWKMAGAMTAGLVVLSAAGIHLDARHALTFVATDLGTLGGTCSEASAVSDKGVVVGRSSTAVDEKVRICNVADPEQPAPPPFHGFVWTEDTGIKDLGTPSGDDSLSWATLIGNDEVLAGIAGVRDEMSGDPIFLHAFVRTQATGLVPIPTLGGSSISPFAINSKGAVVGSSFLLGDQASHAFLWTQRDGIADLDTLDGTTSEAHAISDNGIVVGQSRNSDNLPHAFMWTRHDRRVDLGTLGGLNSTANGVNNDGVIVGTSDLDLTGVEQHAFVWTRRTGMLDIGENGFTSFGEQINGHFVIGQMSRTGSFPKHGFVWTRKSGLVEIVPPGGGFSHASGVNDSGVVVGNFSVGSIVRAFMWSASSGFVPLESGNGSSQANAINGDFIVGSSCETGDAVCHAILWKPPSHSHHHQDNDDQD